MYFHYFVIISPRKRAWRFFRINLNVLHSRILCVEFGWNSSTDSEEDENVKSLLQQRQRRRQTTDEFWLEKNIMRKKKISSQILDENPVYDLYIMHVF